MKPVLMIVIDEDEPRDRLARDLTRRYGMDYQIVAEAQSVVALRRLEELRQDKVPVPIVIADLWLPEIEGLELLTRVREMLPSAGRLPLINYSDPPAMDRLVEGATFGLFDRVLARQGFPAEEWLYPAIADSLAEWSRGASRPRIEAEDTILVRPGTRITDGGGVGRLEWLEIEDIASGGRERLPAGALFVLIGGEPHSEWLAGTVACDKGRDILTGRAVRGEAD